MNQCPDAKMLERFSLGGADESPEGRELERHIRGCAACRQAVSEYAAYYRLAESESRDRIESLAARVMRRIGWEPHPTGIVLSPARRNTAVSSRYLLAAEGRETPRFMAVQSYANPENDCVARLMRDNASRALTLYLVSGETGFFSDQLVEIEGLDRVFVPDARGRIPLSGLGEEELSQKTLHLRSPIASFDLEPVPSLTERILADGRFELTSGEYDRIQIEVDEQGGKKRYAVRILNLKEGLERKEIHVVVSQSGDLRLASQAHQGVAVFEELNLEKILKIKIY
ncbi:hypothetical protein JW906_04505 [bacterium]|nr:hypothetical protein [bacterium]